MALPPVLGQDTDSDAGASDTLFEVDRDHHLFFCHP